MKIHHPFWGKLFPLCLLQHPYKPLRNRVPIFPSPTQTGSLGPYSQKTIPKKQDSWCSIYKCISQYLYIYIYVCVEIVFILLQYQCGNYMYHFRIIYIYIIMYACIYVCKIYHSHIICIYLYTRIYSRSYKIIHHPIYAFIDAFIFMYQLSD